MAERNWQDLASGDYDDSAQGQRLLREADIEGADLPVASFYDGTVLADPSTADLFGANIVIAQAAGLRASGPDRIVSSDDGAPLTARAVIIATGASRRRRR